MAKLNSSKTFNLVLVLFIVLLIIPQTRKPIQVFLNKLIVAIVEPSVIDDFKRVSISDYNWELKDISGNHFDFNLSKGKIIVINFWATWCPPCIAEMPSLQDLYEHYQDNEQVEFLFVSNEDIEVINRFVTKKRYSFNVYQSLTPYPSEFNVSSIPRTFIINKSGEIVIDKTGPADWNSDSVISTIDELLKAF